MRPFWGNVKLLLFTTLNKGLNAESSFRFCTRCLAFVAWPGGTHWFWLTAVVFRNQVTYGAIKQARMLRHAPVLLSHSHAVSDSYSHCTFISLNRCKFSPHYSFSLATTWRWFSCLCRDGRVLRFLSLSESHIGLLNWKKPFFSC